MKIRLEKEKTIRTLFMFIAIIVWVLTSVTTLAWIVLLEKSNETTVLVGILLFLTIGLSTLGYYFWLVATSAWDSYEVWCEKY